MTVFSSFMDRTRLDQLEAGLARVVLDMLKSYENGNDCVFEAVLDAGYAIYKKQRWGLDVYNDLVVLTEAQRLLWLARNHDGAWHPELGPVQQEIDAAPDKRAASVEEIVADVVARVSHFEEMGYQPVEIGRALARVGLTFAPVGFIDLTRRVIEGSSIGRAERERAMLDECLGKDRYPAKKTKN